MRFGTKLDIKFNVKDLLSKIEVNRTKHEEDYNLAVKQYTRELKEELEKKVSDLESGLTVEPNSALVKPVEYLTEYDRALDILNMTTQVEVELDQTVFAQLVRDEWDWKSEFIGSTISYAAKMR